MIFHACVLPRIWQFGWRSGQSAPIHRPRARGETCDAARQRQRQRQSECGGFPPSGAGQCQLKHLQPRAGAAARPSPSSLPPSLPPPYSLWRLHSTFHTTCLLQTYIIMKLSDKLLRVTILVLHCYNDRCRVELRTPRRSAPPASDPVTTPAGGPRDSPRALRYPEHEPGDRPVRSWGAVRHGIPPHPTAMPRSSERSVTPLNPSPL